MIAAQFGCELETSEKPAQVSGYAAFVTGICEMSATSVKVRRNEIA